jgi:hypothetical protein
MIFLEAHEIQDLINALEEEIQYYERCVLVPIAGGSSKPSVHMENMAAQASKQMIEKYAKYKNRLEENKISEFSNTELKNLSIVCKDHIQSVQKHAVVKHQINGTVSEKHAMPEMIRLFEYHKGLYINKYLSLAAKLRGVV